MRKTFENNRCFFCPKVFCCEQCRIKHENTIHKSELCQIYSEMSKSPHSNSSNQLSKPTENVPTAVQAVNVSEIQAAEISPKTPLDNGRVEQLIVKFSRTTSMSQPSKKKDRKSVDHEGSIYQGDSQQFLRQIGATSTPYQMNNANNSNDISTENKDENDIRTNEGNYEITIPRLPSEPTKYSRSNFNEYKETQGSMDVEVSDISDFRNSSMELKDAKLTDTPSSVQTFQIPSLPVKHQDATVEERDNIVNEETDSRVTDTTLWVTANSFPDHSKANKEPSFSSDGEDDNSSAQYIEVYKLSCSTRNDPAGEELNVTNSVSNTSSPSIAGLSQNVWQTITNSLKSALNTTKDIYSITKNISKRSLDIIENPSAKRRKYEPYLKCRPPIHDLGQLVMSRRVISTPILRMDKSTQTEDCYFV